MNTFIHPMADEASRLEAAQELRIGVLEGMPGVQRFAQCSEVEGPLTRGSPESPAAVGQRSSRDVTARHVTICNTLTPRTQAART